MSMRWMKIVCVCAFLAFATGGCAFAQGRGPGGMPPHAMSSPPPAGHGPNIPNGPGGFPSSVAGGNRSNSADQVQPSSTVRSGVLIGPVGRWWDNRTVVQVIGLRKDQQKKMDAIFNANKPAILGSYKTFLSEQAKLEAISKDPKADKNRLFVAIDTVSEARASLQKATTEMLLQIRQQMDAEQIAKLEKLQ